MKFLPEKNTMKKIASYSFGAVAFGAVVGMSYFGYVNQIPVSSFTNAQLNAAANLGTYGTIMVGTIAKIAQFTGAQFALATAYGTAFVSFVGGTVLGVVKAVQHVINDHKANEAGQILQSASDALAAKKALEADAELEANLQAEREINAHLQAERALEAGKAPVTVKDRAVPFQMIISPAQKTSSAPSIETFTITSTPAQEGTVLNPDVILTPTTNLTNPQSLKVVKRKLAFIDPSLLESPIKAPESNKLVETDVSVLDKPKMPSPIQIRRDIATDALRVPSPTCTYNLRSSSPARELPNPSEVDVANILDKPSNSPRI